MYLRGCNLLGAAIRPAGALTLAHAKCRPAEAGEEDDGDKWSGMEFWVKWKRWSYRHCSWDTLHTLSQLGGYKRVLNYCKRQDEMEVRS